MRALEALLVLALLTAWVAGFVLVLRNGCAAAGRAGRSASTAAATARCSSSSSAPASGR